MQAFGELVRRHQTRVYRVALRMLGSRADAEDAAQETFVQAWRALGHFRGSSAFATWLYRIVTNRCLNLLGSRRIALPLEIDVPEPDGDPAYQVEQRERFAAIIGSVAALPGEQRAALVLRDFEGLSYDDVAEVLEVSLPAVKGRIHRARLAVCREAAPWQ